ncbi:hypothetical protein AUK10_04205 [Candidatus Gracilibacteria bacterium CG2_30_37_12]|nr:MAG: hypothetical protein AUK10_04205 [Candidatus Gracilibacteria bacterium CG2_30_37_12]
MITGVIGFIKTVLQLFSDSTNVWSLSFMESYKEYYGGYILEILITAIVMAIFIYLMNIWTKKKK